MKEGKHITIQIAGQAFVVDNPKESVETIREIELNFNQIWAKWCRDFPDMSKQDVLAMVAFQYARYYHNLSKKVHDSEKAIIECENRLDDILLNVDK